MGNQADSAGAVISLPKGGGAVQGIGEKFSPDLYTGTGNFTIPIAIPSGRNGFKPQLSLVYSSGSGNSPFGLGWALSVPGVSRKTSKGIPRYIDADTFLLSGSEDLVLVPSSVASATQYRPRTEGLFAQILHHNAVPDDYWEVKTKDGLISHYGTKGLAGKDPAVIADPKDRAQSRRFAWKLSRTADSFGNVIQYTYARDKVNTEGVHKWDQLYLSTIQYVDYGTDPANPTFLITIKFTYADRPDHFSDYRAGFEIRTTQRCTQIDVLAGSDGSAPARTYYLDYLDQHAANSGSVPPNAFSLLYQIRAVGHDGPSSEQLPPIELGYTTFQPNKQTFIAVEGSVPVTSLADPTMELVDLFGSGLPDILQMDGQVRYWRNKGAGEFAVPQYMDDAPAGLKLSDDGVQILDANGDGRPDLLLTTTIISGYFPLQFGGLWDRRSFQRYQQAPSFNLKDPEVRLIDLDGDGVTDALRSSTQMEYYFNDAAQGWVGEQRAVRQQLPDFPNVDLSDPRVKLADMTGDGLQDIVFVHDGLIEYWPSFGRGVWGQRIEMRGDSSLRFPNGYDPKRVLLGDIDGDGAADLVYVDNDRVTVWINQCGNQWGPAISIIGTPPVSDLSSIRLADLLGNGISGVLWTANADGSGRSHYFFLDFTGGVKPYLLNQMNNHIGSVTKVVYKPSTWFYLQDQKAPNTRWITPLPFPVQIVASVATVDQFAGTLSTEYSYHHGYWDGFEREFRGFGRVDQRDTQLFDIPYYTPATETRTWFHQGNIGDPYVGWSESDSQDGFGGEYFKETWPNGSTPQVLSRPPAVSSYLKTLKPSEQRDAFRSMRGRVLRTELYALDGTSRQSLPYTITEHVHSTREVVAPGDSGYAIFSPFLLSERTTQWDRGNDPLTVFTFSDSCDGTGQPLDYDAYGQPLSKIDVAVPRGFDFQAAGGTQSYLATQSLSTYAQAAAAQSYIVDRVSSVSNYELINNGSLPITEFVQQIQQGGGSKNLIAHTVNFYDGNAFQGLPFEQIGNYGALVRTDELALTNANLQAAYGATQPPYIIPAGAPQWTAEYPQEFQNRLLPCAGYRYQSAPPYQTAYYRTTVSRQYDFQGAPPGRGLVTAKRDALGYHIAISYDQFSLLPVSVTDAAGLVTTATYDYRVFQPTLVGDPNGNQTQYSFSPLGLLQSIAVMGQKGQQLGDAPLAANTAPVPSSTFAWTFLDSSGTPLADLNPPQPASVTTTRRIYHANQTTIPQPQRDQTIIKIEYSDGLGRVLQMRSQAETVLFDSASPTDPIFGDAGLPPDQSSAAADAIGQQGPPGAGPFVVVSGWQVYDNKGQVVEKYEPFFATGWSYGQPSGARMGQKATLYYDPRGRLIRTVNPDGSEQCVVFGVPGTIAAPDLSNPEVYEPTTWEAYTYDPNDNAGRTHPTTSAPYQYQWNTPLSIVIDALGRTILSVQRNRSLQADGTWSGIVEYRTASTYDIRGNLLQTADALGRVAFTYAYDLVNRVMLSNSIDGGPRTSVLDAGSNVVEQRDTKGALLLHLYDADSRAIRLWARDATGQAMGLRERVIYGDDSADSGLTQAQAVAANLLGKPYKHYDEAGLLAFNTYDFKNNLLDSTRNVIAESALLAVFKNPPANWNLTPFRIDWGAANPPPLDAIAYESTMAYDALNRIMTMQYPQGVDGTRKQLTAQYNAAAALESVSLDGTTYVDRIAYNAKGQRILIAYGNGQMTRFAYDPPTFRLVRMRTESYTKPSSTSYHPSAPAAPLQEFGYSYDLVGNILAITDRTPASGIPNTVLGPDALNRAFTYDPVYRLISATGRECDVPPAPPPWTDTPRCTDITKARAYTERYQYDNVGNMALWNHTSGVGMATNRQFSLAIGNDQLSQLTIGSTSYSYSYDANGNLLKENTERNCEWDESDRMRVFRIQTDGAAPSVYTQYLYASTGRVMKLTRFQGGNYETTVYIGNIFEHQRSVTTAATIENNSFHVMDNRNRIAVVRVGNALPGDPAPNVPIKYHFGDHLGSSNVVVDDIGTWINREEYLPFGETSFGSFARKRYRFTGKERDEESGFNYHGARYYAPWLARWSSCDPLGATGGLNLYLFAESNPLNWVDRGGKQAGAADAADAGAVNNVKTSPGAPSAGQPPMAPAPPHDQPDTLKPIVRDEVAGYRPARDEAEAARQRQKDQADAGSARPYSTEYELEVAINPSSVRGIASIDAEFVQPAGPGGNPGHTVVDVRHDGQVQAVMSFGPAQKITDRNLDVFNSGQMAGATDHTILSKDLYDTYTFPITGDQASKARQAINDIKADAGNYTIERQCTSVALDVTDAADVKLPRGVGKVMTLDGTIKVSNPYNLDQELKSLPVRQDTVTGEHFRGVLPVR